MKFASLILTSALLSGLVWSGTLNAADLADGLSACAGLKDDSARLRCYDQLAAPETMADIANAPQAPIPSQDAAPAEPAAVPAPQAGTSIAAHDDKKGRWLGIRPYRRNYILPASYNSRLNQDIYGDSALFHPEDIEIKFQLSFELPVWKDILGQDIDLYFAYTQLSFFQAYNTEYSSPFRDTSYEPEMGLNWQPDLQFMGWRLTSARLALNHQSNGRTEPLSRSWNRLIGQLQVSHGDLALGLRVWKRLREDAVNDDNPDITDYLGHGEFFGGYDLGRHRFGLMLRNPVKHAALQLDWSYLLNDRVRFYVQYFNGFGESLIDYNRQANRIGAGFLLNEWP